MNQWTSDGNWYPFLNAAVISDDDFFSLPEEIQEQVNAHEDEFSSYEEIRDYIHYLLKKS